MHAPLGVRGLSEGRSQRVQSVWFQHWRRHFGGSGGAMLVGGICVAAGVATGGAAAFACGLVGSLGRAARRSRW